LEECWPCQVFANYTLAFALELRKKHGKPSVRVAEEDAVINGALMVVKAQCVRPIIYEEKIGNKHSQD
jgi:hypothetical protein